MKRLIAIAAVLFVLPPAAFAAAEAPLRIISIDVDGGAATLYVTPKGHALLIDTGWPAGRGGARGAPGAPPPPPMPSSAQRILAAAHAAGVTKLDYLVMSHYHIDHLGGVQELVKLMPIGTVIDHGPNREETAPDATPGQQANAPALHYPEYVAAIQGLKRRVIRAGETIRLDDLVFTAVGSDGERIAKPMRGAGGAGADCASATRKDKNDNGGEENPRSVGLLAQWGRARILALADTSWNAENALVCPVNLIGRVDLMFADDHGSDVANSPTLLNSVRPTVVLMNNGATKGAAGPALDRVTALTGPQGLWQLHFATRTPDKNAPADQIANPDGPDAMAAITVTVSKNGSITLTNGRNGFARTYAKAPR